MNRRLKIVIWSLIIVCLAGALVYGNFDDNHVPDNVIRVGLESPARRLDPRFATDAASSRVNRLIYNRLVDFDEKAMFIPSLASWSQLSPKHYRFILTPERRPFHDGRALTATDVKATYENILDPKIASPHRASLSMIEQIIVLDDNTVDFVLNAPDPLFPSYLVIGILPSGLLSGGYDFSSQPVGSGAFSFVRREGDSVLLKRVADGQVFSFVRVPSPETRVLKLLSGEIDLLQNELMPELESFLTKQSEIKVLRREGTAFAYIGFNFEDPVTGKTEIRKAIAHAIDRKSILNGVLGGNDRLATGMFPPEHWATDPTIEQVEFDPELSKTLLSEQGYGADNPLKISYKTSTNPLRLRIATIIQHQLKSVNIDVVLQSYDWGTFYGDIKKGRFQMYSLMWVGIKSPDIFEYVFHSRNIPPAGANRGRYVNPVVDGLLDEAHMAADLENKVTLLKRVQQHISKDLPYVPLWYEDHFVAMSERIEGYRISPDGNYDSLINVHIVNKGVK